MDSTTTMLVNQIKENGYWRQGESLGKGGWGAVYQFASDWKNYVLLGEGGEVVEKITAKDDETAIKAFCKLYHLDMIPGYEILEKITEYRTVAAE